MQKFDLLRAFSQCSMVETGWTSVTPGYLSGHVYGQIALPGSVLLRCR